MEKKDLINLISENGIKVVRLWFTDVIGRLKGFNISLSEVERALSEGIVFDGSSIEGFVRIEESDLVAMPDLNSVYMIPEEIGGFKTISIICDVLNPDYSDYKSSPRYVLKKMLQQAVKSGFSYMVGPELEYFYFPDDSSPTLLDEGGYFDILPTNRASVARRESLVLLTNMGIEIETTHHEVANSQHEIDFKYNHALKIADHLQVTKLIVKEKARKNDLFASFMPKPIAGINGSGLHVHQSLFDRDGQNVFYAKNDKYNLSDIAKQFIAGILKHAPEFTAVTNQWINSYKRLVVGYEAPVYICWGRKNRSALIRVPAFKEGKSQSCRIEYRAPDPACNPYLAFAVMLGAGLAGIENSYELCEPVEKDIFKISSQELKDMGIGTLPDSLVDAVSKMKESKLMKDILGEELFHKYIANKMEEWERFKTYVTDFEIKNYLPVL